ncbi:fimbrillin family protein [Bacteroides thetaiotaomicron]|nr:fimbrillin family protein [Bacteroides thetaiotaomicron]
MMKTNYLFIGMVVLMMTACSNDKNETQVNDGRVAVSFAGGITLTRATTDAWEANDGIGIYMLEHGTKTVADGAANRKYVTTAGNGEFTPAGVGTDHLLSFECG